MAKIPQQPNRGRGASAEDKRWAEIQKRNPKRGGGGGGRIGGGGSDWKGGGGCAVVTIAFVFGSLTVAMLGINGLGWI